MQTLTEMALMRSPDGLFTREQASIWAHSHGPRLDGLIKRAVTSGELWRIRRGLFCLSDRYVREPVNPLALAQLIHGPSYISLHTSLRYHDWIPEAVHAVTSVTRERTRSFDTPIGLFSYTRIPHRLFLAGVRRVEEPGGRAFFMAVPLKALSDLVHAHRLHWHSLEPVVQSLRVEPELLHGLSAETFDEVMSAYGPGRVLRFLEALRKELGR